MTETRDRSELDLNDTLHSGDTGNGSTHRHPRLALVVISLTQLIVVLDAAIVNVALPSIQRALHFSEANLIWVINGYTLAFGGLLLLGGRTGDLFGRRRMFLIGVGLFTTASFLGGLATSETWLIGARVLQGMGGAIAAPTALALIASTFDEGPARNRCHGRVRRHVRGRSRDRRAARGCLDQHARVALGVVCERADRAADRGRHTVRDR